MRTKIIENLSNRERGFKAERIPMGNAMTSQRSVPPTIRESVTGKAEASLSATCWWVTKDRPKSPWPMMRQTKCPYCWMID